ncbi:MAG: polyribonucleotide nucleotidyltransferase, partial [Candidatus Omnitrophota bacterium]
AQVEEADLDIVVCATTDGVIMIESGATEIIEADMLKAVELGIKECSSIIDFQKKIISDCGKKKQEVELKKLSDDIVTKVKELSGKKLADINSIAGKDERMEAMDELLEELVEKLVTEDSDISGADVATALYKIEKESIRNAVLKDKKRVDGRGFDEIRQISCDIGILPRTHGSALFTRGQTQSLAVTTLGTGSDEQMIESLEGGFQKSFMLHYNFPPFSVGEVKPLRGPGRREIGHGALAERALKPMMPDKEEFPYTVRLVSDILESNGSSSMATACAGSLAMMDAGVPMKKAVAGIAMGLVKEGDSFEVLTDIAGVEDHYGDMDFKVAGTTEGITAMQVDIKLKTGITMAIITKAIGAAKEARLSILEKMKSAIDNPRDSISEFAPQIVTLKIKPERVKDVIGPGGKVIKKIIADTGVSIDIEDEGIVNIASSDHDALKKAVRIVEQITEEPEVGKIYHATVKRVMAFGAFCEILPNKEGLVHVSELSNEFVKNVEDVVEIGDEVDVKLIKIDEQGRLNLSIKQAQAKPESENNDEDTEEDA